MNLKYQNKYRIPSTRLPNYDYASDGAYFITICTKNMQHHFGHITNGIMHLSEIGQFAEQFWAEIPKHFSHITLGDHVVMPNHMHGILIIDNAKKRTVSKNNPNLDIYPKDKRMAAISPKSGAIPTIIRSYKSAVTRSARPINKNFAWLPRYYDHIIQNEHAYERIANYIINNPKKWTDDKFY